MKKHAYKFFLAASLLALFSVTPTSAQIEGVIVAKVPFNFSIREKTLPPGDYIFAVVQIGSSDALRITSADHHTVVVVPSHATQVKSTRALPKLVFNRYADRYFLSEVYGLDDTSAQQLARNRDEDRIARSASERSIVSIAARKP